MSIAPKICDACQACQCTPAVLATWRGNPTWPDQQITSQPNGQDWLDNVAAKAIAGTQWQWRIVWNHEDKAAERDRVLAGFRTPPSPHAPVYGWGGPVRDGRLINLPDNTTSPSWWTQTGGELEWPWRLEIGCVRCRCRGTRQIFWPIRHDWKTVPISEPYDPDLGYGPIVGVEQTQTRVTTDYGRALSIHEAGRDFWWGDSGQPITEPRPCPPTEIRWWHKTIASPPYASFAAPKYGYSQDVAGYQQLAVGWHSSLTVGGVRESFAGVSLDSVNRVTLLQPPIETPSSLSTIAPLPQVADDPADIPDADIDALVSWLDDGPPRLLTISGAGGMRERLNEFLARFCGLSYTPQPYGLSPSTTAIRFVARDHELVDYPWQSDSLPLIGQWRWQYPGAAGGDVLYDLTWTIGGVDYSYPAVVSEARPNGSRIVLAPQWGYAPDSGTPTLLAQTDSPYEGWLSHSAAMLADTKPTVPRGASITG